MTTVRKRGVAITRAMMERARDSGWDAPTTADNYGVQPRSVRAACERFGIALRRARPRPYVRAKTDPTLKEVVDPRTLKPKGVRRFSASPEAIERALKELRS